MLCGCLVGYVDIDCSIFCIIIAVVVYISIVNIILLLVQ